MRGIERISFMSVIKESKNSGVNFLSAQPFSGIAFILLAILADDKCEFRFEKGTVMFLV
jgi:hypothetical protein